jgi:uncharacterized protein YcbK (DUF882 family)
MTQVDGTGRRRVLMMGLAGAATLLSAPAMAALPKRGARSLSFHHLHTGENLRVDYWVDGDYVPGALGQLNHLLRDFRNQRQIGMDPKLFDLLYALRGKLDTASPFRIISGYRSPATNAMLHRTTGGVASHSLHMDGMAIDISLADRSTADLYRAARALRAGGAGYYPKSGFVHVDTGRVRYW